MGYKHQSGEPHLVAVNEIMDNGKRIEGHNSHGPYADTHPKREVKDDDVSVFVILVQWVKESGTQGSSADLCYPMDPGVFASFPRTSKFAAFGADEQN